MKIKKSFSLNKLFWVILFLAIILRFYKLGAIPLSLDWDEVSNGYNAYSILKTGRDEYGNFLPLYNRSFDDYKPPLYMYFNVPTVALFGLSEFAIRLPSALFGTATITLIYFLAKRLFENEAISLLSMFFLAISPWHLQFSRVGFEANLGLFFGTATFTLLLYSLNLKNKKFETKKVLQLILAGIFLGLSLYSYHSLRIFSPLMLVITLILFKDSIFRIPKRFLLITVSLLVLLIVPIFAFIPKNAISQRFETTSLKARLEDINASIRLIEQDQEAGTSLGNIIHNRRIIIIKTFFANYFAHFDLNFLFTKGDGNLRHHIEGMGMLYLFQLPLILFGLYLFVKNRSRQMVFVLTWLLISPIPSVFGDAVPHAVRSLLMIVPLSVISAYASVNLYQEFKFKKALALMSVVLIAYSILLYLHNYWSHYPFDQASSWQYGYKEAVLETQKLKDQYAKINVDSSVEQAYIFWLFYTKFNPSDYQKDGNKAYFDKYHFGATLSSDKGELSVSSDLPQSFEVIKTINAPNGLKVLEIGHPK